MFKTAPSVDNNHCSKQAIENCKEEHKVFDNNARFELIVQYYSTHTFTLHYQSQSQSPFPRQMAHRAVTISVSIALGHASANAVKATAGYWSTGSSASLTFPLHSHTSSASREGSEYHF